MLSIGRLGSSSLLLACCSRRELSHAALSLVLTSTSLGWHADTPLRWMQWGLVAAQACPITELRLTLLHLATRRPFPFTLDDLCMSWADPVQCRSCLMQWSRWHNLYRAIDWAVKAMAALASEDIRRAPGPRLVNWLKVATDESTSMASVRPPLLPATSTVKEPSLARKAFTRALSSKQIWETQALCAMSPG